MSTQPYQGQGDQHHIHQDSGNNVGEEAKESKNQRVRRLWNTVLWFGKASHSHCGYLPKIYTRLNYPKFRHRWNRWFVGPPMTEEILTVDNWWEKMNHSFLRIWQVVDCPDLTILKHIWPVLTGFSNLPREVGVEVGRSLMIEYEENYREACGR